MNKTPKPKRTADGGSDHRLVRRSWRDHEMMWVIGCIDADGAITARPSKQGRTHRPDESRGKRWRWCVWSQEMTWLVGRTVEEINNPRLRELTDEEYFTVCDWLIRHGYADESILPKPELRHRRLVVSANPRPYGKSESAIGGCLQ